MNETGPYQPPTGDEVAAATPERIGRYRIERILGKGGFGIVYLAHDEQLQRLVAVKVPHRRLVSLPEDAEAYLTEARTVANLDHPNIVPVYDVGDNDEYPVFIVSKYIEGSTLARRIKANRPTVAEAAELAATVAETLQYAHRKGLVHRDIKPSNILLDINGKPFVADFGLALREQDIGKGPRYAGTPPYMSPEQARGEGHRVDGRSDIFSLGVVFYELLTGQRPFHADIREELLEQITNREVRPPRQWDETIPKELERICLKTLSKRASERYTTATDMADDLRHWLRPLNGGGHPAEGGPGPAEQVLEVESGLSKHVFISYTTADQEAAFRLCRLLEEQGIGCWIAPRDVNPGDDYGVAIIRAIEGTAATLLLLSAHANASVHVTHEVERATSKRKRVIPVRLEDVKPSASLELHLATAHWVDAWRFAPHQVAAQLAVVLRGEGVATLNPSAATPPITPGSDQEPIKIVPKGLRSFDAHDADFFLELLPGPRDRDGLPDSIRFWKTRIEEKDADNTFSVGLIYGPSGCGKSSLVKAGLLPRLAKAATAVYVEATADETEARLLKGLRRQVPDMPANLGLIESLAAFRQRRFLVPSQKVLLVLDQFEQWLHAKRNQENTELVQALRQCDGDRVQCIVMVRDDFWLAVSRFMQALEIVPDGRNSRLVDLFDLRHARKVMIAFGRAFGALPEKEPAKDQEAFLEQAVSGLAQEGKVISVRLALFAEMMKGKPWTPITLKEVGGTAGVGVTFLEETFTASTAPPQHRLHQKAAQAVLKALLPESGSDIKGHMRSHAELLAASGYANRPRDFDDLLRILDSEIRLLTPTDPEGKDDADPSTVQDGGQYYQLTHDYLVPSLRDWLTRKQKETRRGRAELLLADRAVVWNALPENRQLPSLLQWLQIGWWTRKKNWTSPQRKMMRRARWYHTVRGLVVLVLLSLIGWGGYEVQGTLKAHALVDSLLHAETTQVPGIVADMPRYRRWLDPLLRDASQVAKSNNEPRQQLHVSLALLPVDASQVDYLYGRLLDAEPGEVPAIRDALAPYKDGLLEKLWAVVEASEKGKESQRLRAASALARYNPVNRRWELIQDQIANDLVGAPTVWLATWTNAMRPVANTMRIQLFPRLSLVFRDRKRLETERLLAAEILAEYVSDQPEDVADLLLDADEKQFVVLYPKVKEQADRVLPVMTSEIARKLPEHTTDEAKEKLAKRQANAAVALLRMDRPEKVWPLLKHSPDPRVRSYLIHRLSPLGADSGAIIKRFDAEPDITIRRALLLSLGEYGEKDLSLDTRKALLTKFQDIYRTASDPGLHGSAEWLLRQWKQEAWLIQVNEAWKKDREQREKRQEEIKQLLAKDKEKTPPQWYVNGQGQTMVVIPGPVEFLMGSPPTEASRFDYERQHKKRIGRTFALAAQSVTWEQYLKFAPEDKKEREVKFSPTLDCPVNYISWFMAAKYCNWLSNCTLRDLLAIPPF